MAASADYIEDGVEPSYVTSNPINAEININEVQEIDDRIVSFMRFLHQAPEDVQVATAEYLSSIDEVKQSFISNIVKSKKAEKRYEEASRRLYVCQREYDRFLERYLVQIGPDCTEAEDGLDKSKMEMKIAVQTLERAELDLALSKEKLYRIAKKSEHLFISFLRGYRDERWYERYTKPLTVDDPEALYQPLHRKCEQTDRKYRTYAEQTYDRLTHGTMERGTETSSDIASEKSADTTDFRQNDSSVPKEGRRKVSFGAPDEIKVIESTYDYPPCRVLQNEKKDTKEPLYAVPDKSREYSRMTDINPWSEPSSYKPQFSKKKKKSAMSFLKSKIHGPWEGWDDL